MSKKATTRSRQLSKEAKRSANPLLQARKQLERAEQLRRSGDLVQAQKTCENILTRYSDYVAVLHTLGLVLADRRQYAQALPHLVQAAMLNPHDWKTLTVLAGVYLRLGAGEMAVRTLEQAQELQPEDANIQGTLGEIYRENREYELAAAAYRRALALDPTLHDVRSGLGHSCTHLGHFEEAAKAFSDLLEYRSDSIGLLYALSQLPTSLVDADLLTLLENATADARQDPALFESSIAFTRASALSRLGHHDEAWKNLVRANALVLPDHQDANQKDIKIQQFVLDGARRHARLKESGELNSGGAPISLFILGPSRSGKTTTERLADTLDGVKRGYENRIVENAVRHTFQTAGLPTRDWLAELPSALDDLCREFYLKELQQRAPSAGVFTNTHPGHIRSALRIAKVLPNARFVFVKRDLDDITLRIFMKKYSEANSYSYAIESTRAYVNWYYELIDVLAEKLPYTSIIARYEEMIADPKATLSRIAELCRIDASYVEAPPLGDDRGCGQPYRKYMAANLGLAS